MTVNDKICTLERLSELSTEYRDQGKKIIHCHGIFDLLHIGHIRYFEQARHMGDVLFVTVTPDRFVDKGPHRPAFPETLRAEAVASLQCVDHVAINKWPTAEETLRLIRPDVFVKGSEFTNMEDDRTGKIAMEAKVVKEIGAELAFTSDIAFSSSNLINRYLSLLPDELKDYLNIFRKRYSTEEVLEAIEELRRLKVLVIGDTILDEYVYCEAIGKSSKDPVLALKYLSRDMFAGGVLAVANHIAEFAGSVTLGTLLGDLNGYDDFIHKQLVPSINTKFFRQHGIPTIVKRRFVDGYSFNKLFEIYEMDDSEMAGAVNEAFQEWLVSMLQEHDLVIVADFGHGAISGKTIQTLCRHAPFLAVNTQANAGNRGFNTVSKYPRADYICIAEHELRLETRDAHGPVRPMMESIVQEHRSRYMVTTRGRNGCAVISKTGEFVQVPAFAFNVVDRIGAGDAFFAVTSMMAFRNLSSELLGFIGNIVGSLAVEVIGNKKPVKKDKLESAIVSLMK